MKNSMLASARLSIRLLTKRQRAMYVFLIVCRAVLGLFDVLGIAMIGLISAIAAAGLDSKTDIKIAGITLPHLSAEWLVILVCIVLAIFVLKTLGALLLTRRMTRFVSRIETEKATLIARHLLTGNLDEVTRFSKAEIQWAVIGSTSNAFTGVLNDIATLFTESTLLVLVIAMFFLVNPIATIFVALYFGAIVFAIQFIIGRSLAWAAEQGSKGTMGTTNAVNDTLDAYREIVVLGKVPHFLTIFDRERSRLSTSSGLLAFLGGMPRYVVETALILGVVIFVAFQFLTGQLASGIMTIGVFLTGGVRMMASLLPMQGAVAGLKNHTGQAGMAQDLLVEYQNENADSTTTVARAKTAAIPVQQPHLEVPVTGAAVSIKNLTYSYPGADFPTLHDISFDIPAGAKVAIIGPSGAGKTTLVDVILGLMKPTSGEVLIDGEKPSRWRAQMPGRISYVPQRPGLVSGTIAENVALGLDLGQIDHERVRKALEQAHLWEFIQTLPEGVHTSIGKQADALSGGQIQRLGLARALYVNPGIVVLDEATSALDAGAEALVSQTLESLGSDVTVIVIAHRLSTVQHSDCVYVLESGRLMASGKFAELRKNVPMVAEYVELMSFDD
jgi:ABC-type multidrug transport system fused ATPase/permease subunit